MEGTLSGSSSACYGPRARWIALVGLFFSGVVQAAISPPLNWVALQPFAWVPAFLVFSQLRGWRALLAGWAVGGLANAAIFYWLVHTLREFSSLSTPWGVVVLVGFSLAVGFYTGVFALGFATIRSAAGRFWPFAVAAWFAICEFVNPQLFPYYQGVAWYQIPSIFLVVSVTGVAGVSFLVLACNGVVVQAFDWRRGTTRGASVALNSALLLGMIAIAVGVSARRLDQIDRAERAADALRVALVQSNYSVEIHNGLLRNSPEKIAEDLVSMSRDALEREGPIDVFVWPEKILRRSPRHKHNRLVRDFARETGAEIWTGGDYRDRDAAGQWRLFNSAYRLDGHGLQDQRYDKMILVPFGEFMPLEDVFPVLDGVRGVGDFTPGSELFVYDAPGLARFVFLICYEAIRSEFIRHAVQQDVNLLVNLTFDGWYGDTSEPTEHLMLAAIQSALHGVPMLRSTTTGISALIDARGLITQRTGLLSREVLVGEVRPMQVTSLYTIWGEWFAWSCGVVSLGLIALSRWRDREAMLSTR